MSKDIFTVPYKIAVQLEMVVKHKRIHRKYEQVLTLFEKAEKECNKKYLTLIEATIGYYNMFTKNGKGPLINRNKMQNILFSLTHFNRYSKKLIHVARNGYALDKSFIPRTKKSNGIRQLKKIIYNGKEYPTMRALAKELGLHYSTISKHYERHNGDLSTVGKTKLHKVI